MDPTEETEHQAVVAVPTNFKLSDTAFDTETEQTDHEEYRILSEQLSFRIFGINHVLFVRILTLSV